MLGINLDYLKINKSKSPPPITVPDKVVWTSDAVDGLSDIMEAINKTGLMIPTGYIVQKYIDSCDTFINPITYKINTEKTTNITRDALMLGYVCEISIGSDKQVVTRKSLYKIFGKILYEVINDKFGYKTRKLSFDEIYIIQLVSEILLEKPSFHDKEIITSVFFLTEYLISVIRKNNNLLNYMNTIILRTEDLDISILTKQQTKEILRALRTKRKLYLRIFLILSEHMIREKSPINKLWLRIKFSLINHGEFLSLIDDVMIELVLCLVGNEVGGNI